MLPPLMNPGFFTKRNVAIIFGAVLVAMVVIVEQPGVKSTLSQD